MKSKISKILMLCAVTIGMGMSVTSCKDTAEDLYMELANEVWGDGTTGNQALNTQIQNLKVLLTNLQNQVNGINSCLCDTDAVNARITLLQTLLAGKADTAAVNNLLNALGGKADTAAVTSELNALRSFIANTYVSQATYNAAIENLQKQIDSIETCSCDSTIPGRLSKAEQAIIDTKNLVAQAQAAADSAKTAAAAANTLAQAAQTAAQKAQATADSAKTDAAAAKLAADNAKTAADAAKTTADAADALAKVNQAAIGTLNTTVTNINNRVIALGDSLKVAYDRASAANARSLADSIRIDELSKKVADFETETKKKLDDLADEIDDVRQLAIDNLAAAKAYADQETEKVRQELQDAVNDINTKISDLETAYKAADQVLQQQIDELNDQMDAVETKLESISNRLNVIEDILRHLVTNVIVQGTYNPAFGTLRLPTGFNTNVLVAYYGTTANDVYFPTNRTGNYVRPAEALTAKDMQMIGLDEETIFSAGETLINEEGANAGKVYLTVNPANTNFEGLNLSLVNSQDVPSGIKLGALKRSDDVLTFGYTRAANNAFYEAPAYVDAADINKVQRINFNTEKLKLAAKELLNKRLNADFRVVASHLYDVIMGLSLDANAVKVSRKTDTNADSALYSGYDIAATAIKPLSFESYKDLNVQKVPGYDAAMNLIDRVAGKAKGAVKVVFKNINGQPIIQKIQDLEIKKIEIGELSDAQKAMFHVSIDTTIFVSGMKYTLDLSQKVNIKLNTSVTIEEQEVAVPTVTVNSKDNTGKLIVPVKDDKDNEIGTAEVDLGQVTINQSKSTITIAERTYPIVINEDADMSMDPKTLMFGDYVWVGPGEKDFKYVGDGNGEYKGIHLWVEEDLSKAAESLWGSVQTSLGDVNDMLDDIADIVEDANSLLDQLNGYKSQITGAIDKYTGRVKDIIENLNGRVVSLINNVNQVFQPVMFIDISGTTRFLSSAKNYPTKINPNITLVPTTWSLELLVPICKKHLAVTNVFSATSSAQEGDGSCISALKAVNEQEGMNEVVSGATRGIKIKNMRTGFVYEIAYSALDYHGKISTHKYYVTID